MKKPPLNDIDTVIVNDLSRISYSLGQKKLINQIHLLPEKGKVFLQLVNAEYRTRIEVFAARSATLFERLDSFKIGDNLQDSLSRRLTGKVIIDHLFRN